MKVICVDDEVLALNLLLLNCSKIEEISSVKGFSSPAEALDYAASNAVDVAFCDIDMPDMDGITLSRKLRELNPNLNVIITTAYDKYALDAYKNDCSGYILKPISVGKIKHQLSVLRFAPPDLNKAPKRVIINCLGNFQVLINGKLPEFKYAKTLELFAVLVDAQGSQITNKEIMVTLWDDDNHEEYYKKLRKDMLDTFGAAGCDDIFYISRGMLGIKKELVDCDFYKLLDGISGPTYLGKYMSQYSWAETTNSYLEMNINVHQ